MNKKTRTASHAMIIASATTLLLGCSASRDIGDSIMRSEPAMTIPHKGKTIVIDPAVNTLISMYMVNRKGEIKRAASDNLDTGTACIQSTVGETIPFDYIVVDISAIIADPTLGTTSVVEQRVRRNKIAEIILFAADHNHNLFMNRVFTYQSVSKMSKGIMDSLLNGGEVIAGLSNGHVASALAGAQLGLNSVTNEIDQQLFFEKSLQAIQKIVDADRLVMRATIDGRLSEKNITSYSTHQMLRDVDRYNETSSFRFIASSLNASAQDSADGATGLLMGQAKAGAAQSTIPASLPAPTRSELKIILEDNS